MSGLRDKKENSVSCVIITAAVLFCYNIKEVTLRLLTLPVSAAVAEWGLSSIASKGDIRAITKIGSRLLYNDNCLCRTSGGDLSCRNRIGGHRIWFHKMLK